MWEREGLWGQLIYTHSLCSSSIEGKDVWRHNSKQLWNNFLPGILEGEVEEVCLPLPGRLLLPFDHPLALLAYGARNRARERGAEKQPENTAQRGIALKPLT